MVDCAVAASAVLAVTRPHMTGLGGDLFCLIYLAREGRVVAINSSGPAPAGASIDFFKEKGLRHIPQQGPLSIEGPGGVAGWEAALRQFGTMPLADLLRFAVDYAEGGVPVTPNLARAIADGVHHHPHFTRWMETFAPGGRAPRAGEVLKQPNLARSLRALQEGGADAFYRGEIGRAITQAVGAEGGLLSMEDLAACKAEVGTPIQGSYRGYTVFEQPPPTQGHLLLQELALAEGFDLASMGPNSPEAVHLMVESKKLAFADRLRYLADPAFVDVPMDELVSRKYADRRREAIDRDHAIVTAAPGLLAHPGGDTTHHCVMDSEGNAVTMIQSLFHGFGSGFVAGDTGITMNNRLAAFFLDPGHPNALAPGKRTAHTLNSYMLFREDRPFVAGGTPGADDQVQVSFQVISNLIDHGMSLQEAIEAPRWSSVPGTQPQDITSVYELQMEDRFPGELVEGLKSKGHAVSLAGPWSFGSTSAVLLDPESGVLCGGADPRRDGHTAAW